MDDYRCTKFCPPLVEVQKNKDDFVWRMKNDNPRIKNWYNLIRDNEKKYKIDFMKIYNNKCAYCGVAMGMLPKEYFEVDHYICKNDISNISDCEVDNIQNLVLACIKCNRKKSDFIFSKNGAAQFSPDDGSITNLFYRDDLFNIKIKGHYEYNSEVTDFYNKLKLGSELRRLDYILLFLSGMIDEAKNKDIASELRNIREAILRKRNIY